MFDKDLCEIGVDALVYFNDDQLSSTSIIDRIDKDFSFAQFPTITTNIKNNRCQCSKMDIIIVATSSFQIFSKFQCHCKYYGMIFQQFVFKNIYFMLI
jgi:hypothetical protein